MAEQAMRLVAGSKQEMVDQRNALTDKSVRVTRRIMDSVGIDPIASKRTETPLVGKGIFGHSDGKLVAKVIRTRPIPDAMAGDGSGVRIVEGRDEYHIKRPWVPTFLGSVAYTRSAHSVFYTEAVFATQEEGSDEPAIAEVPPRLGFTMYDGHAGLAARADALELGAERTVSFMTHIRDVMIASCMGWPPTLMQPVRELTSDPQPA